MKFDYLFILLLSVIIQLSTVIDCRAQIIPVPKLVNTLSNIEVRGDSSIAPQRFKDKKPFCTLQGIPLANILITLGAGASITYEQYLHTNHSVFVGALTSDFTIIAFTADTRLLTKYGIVGYKYYPFKLQNLNPYVSVYSKYKEGKRYKIDNLPEGYEGQDRLLEKHTKGTYLGGTLGLKYIAENGFSMDFYMGGGHAVSQSFEIHEEAYSKKKNPTDLRFGFNLGYTF